MSRVHNQLPDSGGQGRIFDSLLPLQKTLLVQASLTGQTPWKVILGEPLPTRRFPPKCAQYPGHTGIHIARYVALFWESRPQPNRPSSSSPKSGRYWHETATSATASRPRSCTRTCGWMAGPPCSMEVPGDRQSFPATRTQASLFRQSATRTSKCLRPEGLSEDQIEVLVKWVEMGAPWPDLEVAGGATDLQRAKGTWPPVRATGPGSRCKRVPRLRSGDKTWPADPIDNFILQKLEAEGLNPSSDADRYTLLRRVHFDLIGLPPKPEDIESFHQRRFRTRLREGR